MRVLWALLRLAFAVLILAAIVAQLVATTGAAGEAGRSIGITLVNFFSYFTIDSNSLAVAVLLVGAGILAFTSSNDPRWFGIARVCVTTYMVTTGVVYNMLLRNVPLPVGAEPIPWSNEVLHVVGPLYLALDWLFAPGRAPLGYWGSIRAVVAFPIVWVIYTLARGPLTPNELTGTAYWYPYPFLDPNRSPNGYLSVAFYVVLIAVIIGLVAAAIVWLSRRQAARGGLARESRRDVLT